MDIESGRISLFLEFIVKFVGWTYKIFCLIEIAIRVLRILCQERS